MSFASNAKKVAKKLIAKYGNVIDLVEYTTGTYDPTTGERGRIETLHRMKGQISKYSIAEMAYDNITANDIKVIIETDLTVTRDWKVLIKGKYMMVIDIAIVTAQDKNIILKLQVRT